MISINRIFLLAGILFFTLAGTGARAQTTNDSHGHYHAPLYFTHALISESPSPDTKIRFDYMFIDKGTSNKSHVARLEVEYAFNPNISVEIDIPYQWSNPSSSPSQNNVGNIEVGLKMASFAFAQHGVLIGGGIELGLPTGDDDKGIGNDHVLEIEPFIDAGIKVDNLEIVGFLAFGIPTNEPEEEKDEEDLEIAFNVALLYHITTHLTGTLEIDGHTVASGEEEKTVVNLTPGLIIQPTDDPLLQVGVGVSFPISNDDEFDSQLILSVFRHF